MRFTTYAAGIAAGIGLLTAMTGTASAQPFPPGYGPPPGFRPPGPPPGYGRPRRREAACVAFQDINFGGAQLPLEANTSLAFVGEGWNDQISSFECQPGCRIVAFEHANFGGARQTFAGSTGFVGQFWNDRISSLEVRCR